MSYSTVSTPVFYVGSSAPTPTYIPVLSSDDKTAVNGKSQSHIVLKYIL